MRRYSGAFTLAIIPAHQNDHHHFVQLFDPNEKGFISIFINIIKGHTHRIAIEMY